MIDRENAMLLTFAELYGDADGVGLARAPGRVNIIGEHTDYNEGLVMPIAIGRDTLAAFRPNGSREVRVFTLGRDESATFSLDEDAFPRQPNWVPYVAGMARVLRDEGAELVGVDMVLHTTLPVGGGLSSSAALLVSTGLAFLSAADAELPRRLLALLGQKAENLHVGMKCGIMDQYVALFAETGHAVEIDCRSVQHQLVPCDVSMGRFIVCDTGVRHELASSEYNRRREQCERGASVAAEVLTGESVSALRDLTPEDLSALTDELDETTFRRVRHVVTENARVIEAANAMRQRNPISLGVLMDASHDSLRDDYEVSCAELDAMVDIAREQTGLFGARMTGGGFGGCTVSLVDIEHVDAFCTNVAAAYQEKTGIAPQVYVCSPQQGAELIRAAG
jgi:galactokinase